MSREIKFRALKDDMSNCNWVYGNLVYFYNEPLIQEDKSNMVFTTCVKGTESQFTGLTDKNCKEIYDGDIIFIEYNRIGNIIVSFEDGKYNIASYNLNYSQVIGNIHENEHLLNN